MAGAGVGRGGGVEVEAVAPGRVNLIGEHTDTTGGLVLPMAIDRVTTVTGRRGGDEVRLRSVEVAGEAVVPIDPAAWGAPSTVEPPWARYVAAVVAEVRPAAGLVGEVRTSLPVGGGLSSSAALEVAVALALGFEGPPLALAQACRRAEQRASGVPCGIMDQLASAAGVQGSALLVDCHDLTVVPVALPAEARVVVVDSGQARELAGSAYAERVAQLHAVEEVVGPLRLVASPDELARVDDRVLRGRARHVVTENARVRAFVAALAAGDLADAGALLVASHTSLRDDLEVSTPVLDALVERLLGLPGVRGARLTGAGFGGCVVALCDPGTELPDDLDAWWVSPAAGAHVEERRPGST